jgi:hypothetical protein
MTPKIGSLERMIRLGVGAVAILGALFVWKSWLIGLLGAILLGTGLMKFCPIWKALGVDFSKK